MSEIKKIKLTGISVNPSIHALKRPNSVETISKEFAMSYFMPFQTAAQEVRPLTQHPSKRIAPSQALAGLLSASVFAALLAVADQVIDSWSDGHMLLAWVMLWLSIFGGLALLTRPMRRASTASALWLQTRAAELVQARREAALWELALRDPRMLQELRAAKARSQDI
jgi:hypothetical protein